MRKISILLLGLHSLILLRANDGESLTDLNPKHLEDKEVVSFIYHRFGDGRYPTTNTSIENFEAHINFLKDNDYQIVTLTQANEYLKSDEPYQKTAVLTIDDGFKSFITNGFPLLKKYGVSATLFINTKDIGSGDYMSWEDIEMLSDEGIEIGNHTETHQYFLNLSEENRYIIFKNELTNGQKLIQEKLGITPKVFAYPFGEYDIKMKEIVEEVGFTAAVGQNSGVIHTSTDPYRMPRFPMSDAFASLSSFKLKSKMKPFVLLEETPTNFFLKREEKQPTLTLKFDASNLNIGQMQCFVQGGECEMKVSENDNSVITLTAKSKAPLHARRTLYTITVPDKSGKWHWFSHLWIKAELK
jgi:peptidoglycan/xylan/chitin deacetylase (PgdA/CDA1 family)